MTEHFFDISFAGDGPLDFVREGVGLGLEIRVDEEYSSFWARISFWSRRDYLLAWMSAAETIVSGASDRVQFVSEEPRLVEPDEERLNDSATSPIDCWAYCAWLESDGLVHVRPLAFSTAVSWFPWDKRNIPHHKLPDRLAHPWGGQEDWTTTMEAVIEYEARLRAKLMALGVL